MQYLRERTQRNTSLLITTLEIFEMVALIGLLFCVVTLVYHWTFIPSESLLLYAIWFGIAMVSTYAMKRGDALGAYSLLVATIVITVFDFASGRANIGGASLGLLVLIIVVAYLRNQPVPETEHHDNISAS